MSNVLTTSFSQEDILEQTRVSLIEKTNRLKPIHILASSKQFYSRMSEEDRQNIFKLHSKIDQSRFRSQYLFYSGAVSGTILYLFRNLPGKQRVLTWGTAALFFYLPLYFANTIQETQLQNHHGDISFYNQKYDWQNDELAKKIVFRSFGFPLKE